MGFLDNSGDIILDAVLTDLGRERLARGDGSFKITKFAAADDEIDYAKYDKNHASGSAYYDLDILTTPVLEAFTNNIGSVKHKLMTIPRNNLLYLPVIKLNSSGTPLGGNTFSLANSETATGFYAITVDKETSETDAAPGAAYSKLYAAQGVMRGDGEPSSNGPNTTKIITEQGLDTSNIPNSFNLDSDLIENQYIIEIDDRLGKITTANGASLANLNFIDDDRIASYYLSTTSNSGYFDPDFKSTSGGQAGDSVIAGPRGTRMEFAIRASLELNTSTSLFTRLGGTFTITSVGNFNYIDSTVRITGVTTGYRLDIPIRFIKKA